jgi:hypothetical protein
VWYCVNQQNRCGGVDEAVGIAAGWNGSRPVIPTNVDGSSMTAPNLATVDGAHRIDAATARRRGATASAIRAVLHDEAPMRRTTKCHYFIVITWAVEIATRDDPKLAFPIANRCWQRVKVCLFCYLDKKEMGVVLYQSALTLTYYSNLHDGTTCQNQRRRCSGLAGAWLANGTDRGYDLLGVG